MRVGLNAGMEEMTMPPISKVAALIAAFQEVPLHPGDMDRTEPYDQSFGYHVWRIWLAWLPGPGESPEWVGGGWHVQRHRSGRFAVLTHDGPVQVMNEIGPDLPLRNRPYDPWANRWCIVGWGSTGSEAWESDLADQPPRTWADAIERILTAWKNQRDQSYGPYLRRVAATIDGDPCGLLDIT